MKVERTALDTTDLISAMAIPGTTFRVFNWMLEIGVLNFFDQTCRELEDRIAKPKFNRYVNQSSRLEMPADFRAVAEWVSITDALQPCRIPDDDKILETALTAYADCIVTGDADILTFDSFENIRVVTASECINHAKYR